MQPPSLFRWTQGSLQQLNWSSSWWSALVQKVDVERDLSTNNGVMLLCLVLVVFVWSTLLI